MRYAIIALLVLSGPGLGRASAQNLIPQPVSIERGAGEFRFSQATHIRYSGRELAPLAGYLAGYIPCPTSPIVYTAAGGVVQPAGGVISLEVDPALAFPAEGYRLEVDEGRVRLAGRDYGGLFNGIQTLLQLLPAEVYTRRGGHTESGEHTAWTIPAITIEDWPAMAYRGVMLDVARTFVPAEQVMRLIDNISHHKINRLHWHLADDEGWRIEIKSYPRLTEISAWRGPGSPVWAVYGEWDARYGGFYTQDEIRQVVAYAALRGVEVIPEIDLPGHSRATAIAYPEILCDYTPSLTASAGYDTRGVFCAAREENYAMLDSIIREVAALFPSPTLHLGGDEVSTGQWKQCPRCRALMAERGITDAARLQDIFMSRVIDIAARHGKRAGVWNEAAAGGGIPRSTTVWGWESLAAARRAAADGYPVVVCPGEYFYFDMRQSPRDIGHIWAGIVTLEKVYSFSPPAAGFTPGEEANLRGVEATLFHELGIENGPGYVDYQLFPRVCALSEVAWTPASERSWASFEGRLKQRSGDGSGGDGAPSHFDRLTAMGVGFRRSEPAAEPATGLKKPAVRFTSSLTATEREPFSRVAGYSGASRTTRAVVEDDWFMWSFTAPVTASRIDIKTGYDHLQRGGVPRGRVEVSYDGQTFETAARFHDLKACLEPSQPVRAIKIVNESHGNGESFTIIQPLKIR